jgi:peptide/nickel transport system substrate-binding protein
MFKGIRGPLLAFVASLVLLSLVLFTRPTTDSSVPNGATPQAALPTLTPLPTITAAPTIPFQQLDTSTLREAVVGCVKKMNPLMAGYNQTDLDVSSLIFEGLTKTDAYGAAVPALAESLTVSTDGLIYDVRLRKDVKWQDGVGFTSADVVTTFSLMQDDKFPGRSDLHTFWKTVDVEAIDDYTVRFTLAQPLAAFTDYLRIGIVPAHVLSGALSAKLASHPFNLAPIGTGPYQLDGLIGTGNQITGIRLRYAATYAERPEGKDGFALRQIIFYCEPSFNDAIAAFQRGDVNTVSELPAATLQQIAALTQLTLYTAYPPSFGAVIYNWQRDPVSFFRDFRMRRALALSVDRPRLVSQFLNGRAVVADSPVLPSSWAWNPGAACPAYDVAAAKTNLAQVQIKPTALPLDATQPADAPSVDPNATVAPSNFNFQLLVNNDPALAALAEGIVKSWNAIGLSTSVVVVDGNTFKERLTSGNFDAALIQLNLSPSSDPDPYSLWRQMPNEGGLNFGGLNERRLSELVETARRETNGVYRTQLYQAFQQLFCDRAAALMMYYPIYAYGADNRLAGIQLGFMSDPSDRFRTIKDWRFVQQP